MKTTAIDIPARVERLLERRKARSQPTLMPRRNQALHEAVSAVTHVGRDSHVDDAVFPASRALPLLP